MTFKDLKKRVSATQEAEQQSRFFNRLDNKPFWIWDIEQHKQADIESNGDCCFNHIIGLPRKNDVERPIFDYEKIIFECLIQPNNKSHYDNSNNKFLWIKKATGLGITEFMLRLMAWLCLRDKVLSGSQMCIVTGPRIDLAVGLINRMKRLFYDKGLVVFHTKDIDTATSKKYDLNYVNPATSKSMGIDPGWGSSAFAVVVTQFQDGEVQVLEATQWDKVDFNEVLQEISTIVTKYDPTKIYIDGANPSFIRSLKLELNEDPEYEKAIEYYNHTKCDWTLNMKVLPVSFAKENKAMLGNCKMILESGLIAIDPNFDKLIISLSTAVANEMKLDKQQTSFNDLLDSLILALWEYQFRNG